MMAFAPGRRFLTLAVLAAACASVSALSPASAKTKEEFAAMVAPLTDIETNQQLEKEFSDLVRKNDEAGLKAMAERVRAKDGQTLDELVAMAKRQTEASTESAEDLLKRLDEDQPREPNSDAELILTLGPCHYAGMLIRNLVVGVAKGEAKPVMRNNAVMIDDSFVDTLFSENMDRCEILRRKQSPARFVGDRCTTTGVGCQDDPDNAEPAEDQDDKK